jgi:nitrous oxidase accessory protein NosD
LVDSGITTPNPAIYVKIAYNSVTGFTKTGILNGRYSPAKGGITADITNNTVVDVPDPTYAANGIAVERGGAGTVMRNTVDSVRYLGEFWTATGILLFEVQGVTVQGNTVTSCQTGIAVGTFGWTGPANNNHIVGNSVLDADWGVSLQSMAFWSVVPPQTNNNKVVNNRISSSTWKPEAPSAAGIEIWTWNYDGSADPVAENNKVIANSISGYATPIDDDGTATKVHANVTP